MSRGATILLLRTTRANLDAQAAANSLLVGEPYFITDENRYAVGSSATTYQTFAKQGEAEQALSSKLVPIDGSTGQVLTKTSANTFAWATAPAGTGSSATTSSFKGTFGNTTSNRWRVYIYTTGDPSECSLVELEMRASPGGVDQTTGGSAFASSEYGSNDVAAYAFDDNPSTWAASSYGIPAFIGYNFASAVAVNELTMVSRPEAAAYAPTKFDVQYYDGSAWQTHFSASGLTWTGNEKKTFTRVVTAQYAYGDTVSYAGKTWFCTVAGSAVGTWGSITGTLSDQADLKNALADKATVASVTAKASLDSPAFTGTPTSPTVAAGNNTTSVATTAFVTTAVATKANLASPTFTGTPAAPTAAAATNTTQVATTAFALTTSQASGYGYTIQSANTYTTPGPRGTITLAADTIYLVPYTLLFSMNLLYLSVNVITAVAGNAKLGVYTLNQTSGGRAFTRVANSGTSALSLGTVGVQTVTLASATSLAPGRYFLAILPSAAATVTSLVAQNGLFADTIGTSDTTQAFGIGFAGFSMGQPYSSGLIASNGGSFAPITQTPLVGIRNS